MQYHTLRYGRVPKCNSRTQLALVKDAIQPFYLFIHVLVRNAIRAARHVQAVAFVNSINIVTLYLVQDSSFMSSSQSATG